MPGAEETIMAMLSSTTLFDVSVSGRVWMGIVVEARDLRAEEESV